MGGEKLQATSFGKFYVLFAKYEGNVSNMSPSCVRSLNETGLLQADGNFLLPILLSHLP